MNKNIRRSLVIAAGVTGAWALGSAVASADELPAHSLSVPDPTTDSGLLSDDGAVADAVDGTAHQATTVATSAVHHTTGTVRGTADAVHGDVSGVLAHTARTGPAVHGAVLSTTGAVQDTAAPAVRTAHDTVARAGDAVHTLVPGAQHTVRHTGATVEDTVQQTGPAVGNIVHRDVSAVGGTVQYAVSAVDDTARYAVPTVGGTAQDALYGTGHTTDAAVYGAGTFVDGTLNATLDATAGTVDGAVHGTGHTVQYAVHGTGSTAQHTVDAAVPAAYGVLNATARSADGDVRAAGRTVHGVTDGTLATADVTVGEAGEQVARVHAVVDGEIDYLFGPLSAFAPQPVDLGQVAAHAEQIVAGIDPALGNAAGDLLGQVPGAGQRRFATGAAQQGAGEVRHTMASPAVAGPAAPGGTWRGDVPSTVAAAADAAMPSQVATAVGDAVPTALQAVGDASYVGQGVLGHTQPFAEQALYGVTTPGQVLGGTVETVREAPGYAVGTAGTAASDTGRLAGHAASGAQDIVGDVMPPSTDAV